MVPRRAAVLVSAALFFAGIETSIGNAQETSAPVKAVQLIGLTGVDVHCQFTNPDGKSLLERDINGKVLFFGGNLKATNDFAKKTAHVTHENFSSTESK